MKHLFLSIICLLVICNAANARKATGEVTCQGKGIGKVIVTDGKSFTKTAADGTFSFDIDDTAEFVYIVTPSGYVADWSNGSPEFYKRVKGNDFFSFELSKTGDGKKEYNIIAVGDPQPRKDKHFNEFIGRPLEDIRTTAEAFKGQFI